jgi:hypothetical protein
MALGWRVLVLTTAALVLDAQEAVPSAGPTLQLLFGRTKAVLSLQGVQNTSYAIDESTNLSAWQSLILTNAPLPNVEAPVPVTRSRCYFRVSVLGTWSLGSFTVWRDLRRDFGATGDGQTDDTAAVQRALDFSSSSPFVVVLVPGGTYRLTRTCTIQGDPAVVPPRLALIGENPARAVFKWDGDSNGVMLQSIGCAFQVSGVGFDDGGTGCTGVLQLDSDAVNPAP